VTDPSGPARASEWWSYKIPPLLAIAYAFILTSGLDAAGASVRLVAAIVSIVAVAAYGYVVNDCFDVESDRRAGKTNQMASWPVWRRVALVAAILFVGWTPAVVVGYAPLACILLAVDFLLPTIYSTPPVRLKERGVWGVLSDAAAAHLVPVLFLASVFLAPPGVVNRETTLLTLAAAFWYSIVGLRGILNHQIVDREKDVASGVTTMVTGMGQVRALQWTRRFLYVLEMAAFLVVLALLRDDVRVLAPVFLVALVLESAKRALGWEESYVVHRGVDPKLRRYLPFANNVFYNLWLPVALAVDAALANPRLVWIPLLHVLLFGRRILGEHREPLEIHRDLRRRARWAWIRLRFGWDVRAPEEFFPRAARGDRGAVRLTPGAESPTVWDLRVLGDPFPVEGGACYQLRIALRADRPRSVAVGVCERASPWNDLGASESLDVGPDWERFVVEFAATRSHSEAVLFLVLGGDATPVEIGRAGVYCIDRPGPWTFLKAPGARAVRVASAEPETWMRFERLDADRPPWDATLAGPPFDAPAGSLIQVRIQLRADRRRTAAFGIAGADAPLQAIGRAVEVEVPSKDGDVGDRPQPAWRSPLVGEFPVESPLRACVFVWLEGDSAPVEVGPVRWDAVPMRRLWVVEHDRSASCRRVVPLDPASFGRVEIDRPGDGPASVRLATDLGSVRAGDVFRVEFEMKSDGPRVLSLVVDDGDPTFEICSAPVETFVLEDFNRCVVDLEVHRAASSGRLAIWLGGEDGAFEWRNWSVLRLAEGEGGWRVLSDAGSRLMRLASEDAAIGRLKPLGVLKSPWGARLLGPPQPAAAGQWRRCRLRVRADRPRSILFGFCASAEPWDTLGLSETVEVAEEWREIVRDFLCTGSAPAASPFLAVGESGEPVDVDALEVAPIDESQAWRVQLDDDCDAERWAPLGGDAQVVRVKRTHGDPWSVQLVGAPRPATRGDFQRFRFEARAEKPRAVAFGLRQCRPPFEPIGHCETVDCDPQWRSFVADFEIDRNEAEAAPFFWLGREAGDFEVRGIRIAPPGDGLRWRLEGADPHAARLFGIELDEDARGVKLLRPTASPWDVKLSASRVSVRAGEWRRLRFRVAASPPRNIFVGLCQGQTPWEVVGLMESVQVGPGAETFALDFQASQNESAASIVFALGGAPATIDIAGVRLERIDPRDVIRIAAPQGVVRRRASDHDPAAIRFVLSPTEGPWSVKASWPSVRVESGAAYRAVVPIRSDAPRTVLIGVAQDHPPWEQLSPIQDAAIDRQPRRIVLDFVAPFEEPAAAVFACLGGSDVAVELGPARLTPVPREQAWRLEAPVGDAVRLAADDDPDAVRVEVRRAADEPWKIKLATLDFPVESGRRYEFRGALRSDRPFQAALGVSQAHAPWKALGLFQRVALSREWTEFAGALEADSDDPAAEFFIWLGAAEGGVDLRDFRVESVRLRPPEQPSPSPDAAPRDDGGLSDGQHHGGDRHVDEDADHVDHAGDERAGTVRRVHPHAQKQERQLRPDQRAGRDDGDQRTENHRGDTNDGLAPRHHPDGKDAQTSDHQP
jgi:4-hydroxybenzoate polyprenyltransferase